MCQVVLLKTLERDSDLQLHRTCYLCPSIQQHRFTSSNTAQLKQISVHSPYDYDDEIQQIPAVPQVGVGVEEQAVGYYL